MRVTQRLLPAVLLGATALIGSGCSALESTGIDAKLPINEAQRDGGASGKDDQQGSSREVTGAGAKTDTEVQSDKGKPTPEPSRPPLDVPEKPYPKPKFPGPPAEDSPELDRIEYELKKVAWTSAGVVAKADSDCSIDDDKLVETGTYDFSCKVSFAHVTTKFGVHAEVQEKQVPWSYRVKNLPISEDKAVYEATRQAYKPAIVTCDIVDVELIRVGQEDALTCWVTDINDKQTPYRGELQEDGTLAFPLGE